MNKKILLAISIFLFLTALVSLVFALGPVITIINPANNSVLPNSTTSVLVEISTNENATCKYDTADKNFDYFISGTQFGITGSTIHNMTWNVSSGNNTFYYKCDSFISGINDIATYHAFSVNSTPASPTIEKICTDSDGGKNYYAKGNTNYLYYENGVLQANSTASDGCAGAVINGSFKPNALREYFCTAQNTTDYEPYDCACSNGVCPAVDTTPPAKVTGLASSSITQTSIYWSWTNPADADFNSAIIYIGSSNAANTSNNYYNATGLSCGTGYTITINTKDNNSNINTTNVTNTTSTSTCTAAITATIKGYAFLEGQTDHSGITVELGINGEGPTGNYATTATNGSYTLYNVSPAAANYYFTWAHKTTYSDGGVNLPEIVAGQSYTLQDVWLNTDKNISFEWAYQPVNASKNLTSGLQTGRVTLFSTIDGKEGFIFSTSTITNPVADIYFGDSSDNPMSFWANNGNGGVIDMGAVSLNSVSTAPDAGYNSQNTSAVIGHTYVVKTKDGSHYAKLYTYIDTTAPVISNVTNATQAAENVTITWATNESANSAVYYGFTTAYGSTATDASYVTSHSVLLAGLTTGGILYHYKVGSCDAAGNCANSSNYNFITIAPVGGESPPISINITIKNPLNGSVITESSTWLNVTTNVNAICKYEFLTCLGDEFIGACGGSGYGYSTMNTTNSTSHSQLITGLSNRVGNKWYEINVNCTDVYIDKSNKSSIRFNVNMPYCTWPSVGDWVIEENEVVNCNNKDITLNAVDYEVTVSSLTSAETVLMVNGETTPALKQGDSYTLADGASVSIDYIGGEDVVYCIGLSNASGSACSSQESGKTDTLTIGGNLYVKINANFTLNNSFLKTMGADLGGNLVIENSVLNSSERGALWGILNYWGDSNNIIKNSTFYAPSRFDQNSVNTITNSSFCGYAGFKWNSTNDILDSKFGVNCPTTTETYTDKETGENITEEWPIWTYVEFSGNSDTKITSSVFNNSNFDFGYFWEDPKITLIDSTIYNDIGLSTKTNDNATIKNIKPGIANGIISYAISPFELNLSNTQIESMSLHGEINSTNTIINSTLYSYYSSEGSTSIVKDSTINETNFDSNTYNTIENSNFTLLGIPESSDTTITDSTAEYFVSVSGENNLTIANLRPGIVNNNVGSIAIANTGISYFMFLFGGETENRILNSDILLLYTGSMYMDFGETSSIITRTTIENSDIGVLVTADNTINKIYNSTFNSTRYSKMIKELYNEEYDAYSEFSNLNNTIENSKFYGKIALSRNTSADFRNSTVEDIYKIGSEYRVCAQTTTVDGETMIELTECSTEEIPTIRGALNITNKTINTIYENVTLTRYYPVYINALGPANNKLVSIKNNGKLVWSGNTDANGYVEAVLAFNSSNYEDTYNIMIDNVAVDNISLTKNTPIKYTIPVIYNLTNSSITENSAAISWNTNKKINAKLYYGLTKAYENKIIDENLSTTHSFGLTGLMPNMLYQYKSESCDEVNYCAVSYGTLTTPEPADNTAPAISNVAASSITTISAAISWDTNEAATSQIEYGATTAYGTNTTLDARLLTSHSFNLTALDYNTQYHYKVHSCDIYDNCAASADNAFTTLGDATAPVISNVQVKEVYEDGAYLYAETNEESWYNLSWIDTSSRLINESNVLVEYGINDSYGKNVLVGRIGRYINPWKYGAIFHIFKPNMTYHFRFAAKDKAGNIAYSDDYNFTTLSTEPVINETESCLYNGDCWINNQCYEDNSTNPADYLQYCDSSKSQTSWSYKAPQFDSVVAWLGDSAGTQEIFYVIADSSQPVSIRGTATPMPGATRTLFFSPINTTTNVYSTNAVVGANRNVSYKIYATNEAGLTAEFSGLVESDRPNLIVRQSDKRMHNSTFKNQTVYIPDNKTVEMPLNDTTNSKLILKTNSDALKKADIADVHSINNPSAYASLPSSNSLESFEINMAFDNSTTNLSYCMSYAGFSSIDENTIEAYKLIGSGWSRIDSTRNTISKEICANILSAQTPYLFAGSTPDSGSSGGGGGGGGGATTITPAPIPKPKQIIIPTPAVVEETTPAEEKTKEETISLFGKGKSPAELKEEVSRITGAVIGLKGGAISSIGFIVMLSIIVAGLGTYTIYERRRYN